MKLQIGGTICITDLIILRHELSSIHFLRISDMQIFLQSRPQLSNWHPSLCLSLHPSEVLLPQLSKKCLTHNHETSHMGAPIRGDELIRFRAPDGTTFNSKTAAKDKFVLFYTIVGLTFTFKMADIILDCPYLTDYLSYEFEIWHKDNLFSLVVHIALPQLQGGCKIFGICATCLLRTGCAWLIHQYLTITE